MPDAPPVVESPPVAAPESPTTPSTGFEEAYGAIDALGRDDGTPEPPPTPTPGDGRKRDEAGKFVPKEKPAEKPADKPKPTAEPNGEEIDPSKLKTSELAKHYHALKAKEKEWVKQREDYEKKLKTPTEWPEKKTYEERLAEREKFLADRDKRIAEYEQELQFTNFTKSQAYKDQYEKPLVSAYKTGQAKTALLQVVERKDEEGNVLQASRDATAADFDAIMRITDERTAIKKAHELFGEAAAVVLNHRERVNEKNQILEEAVKEYQSKGAEREKTMREQQEKHSKEAAGMIENFQKAAVEKYPALFKPDESDPKGNELLDRGNHLLQRVLKGGVPLKDGETQMTNDEMAIAVAAVRNKAAAFDRVAYKASSLAKRVKELEIELAQFKSSKPGNGDGNGRQALAEEETPEQKIDKLGRER